MSAFDARRVLIVDDDPDVRGILGTVLRQQRLLVDEAADGVSALGLLAQNRYGVVLLDVMMPHVDGFAVLEAMHADAAGDPPVVIVVSGADRATLDLLDPERIHGVIRKPFDPLEVGEVVAACIEIRGRNSLGTMALATALATAPLLAIMRW